jgi:type I restriction enzyme, S subunit
MEVKPGYKQTGVGLIPEDWNVKRLGELGEALIGLTYKPSDVRENGTLVLRSSNIQSDALAFDDNVFVDTNIPERIKVRPGDVLICVRNGSRNLIGKAVVLDERTVGMTFGAFMAVFRSPIGRLANYMFQSEIVKRQINEHLGATINQITNKSLNSFRIPVSPVYNEQRAIATALSDVDALLGGLDRLIAKKRDLKQGAMQQLLTGQTRLPGFHGEWEVKQLGTLGTWRGGMTPSMQNPRYWEGGEVPWLSSGEVKASRLKDSSQHVTSWAVRCGAAVVVPANSIVLVTRSGILRKYLPVALAVRPMAINQDLKALVSSDSLIADYLLHALTGFGDHILASCLKTGTTVESVELPWLKAFSIPIPPRDEQLAIAAMLSDMDAEVAALAARRDKTRDLKQAMMQELLTGKTRLVPVGGAYA